MLTKILWVGFWFMIAGFWGALAGILYYVLCGYYNI